MRLINYLQTKLPAFTIFGLALFLTSCGSYQYIGQTSDGIYEDDKTEQITTAQEPNEDNNYYKNYFKEKSLEMQAIEDDEVFVDIDGYQGNYNNENSNEESYGAWGENNNRVIVNVYDNGWNNWGWNAGWGWNNWGWNNWGWNRWNRWGWNAGWSWNNWGWNAGLYDPFWCPPGYGYGFYGRNNIYSRRGLAYNGARRSNLLGRNSASLRNINRSARIRTNGNTISRNRSTTRPQSTTRSRTRTGVNTNTTRPNRSISTPSRTRTQTRVRTTRPTRSSTPRVSTPRSNRSISSPSRSSGRSRSMSSSRGGRRR